MSGSMTSRDRSRSPNRGNVLYIGNIPITWNFGRIKQFIQNNTVSSFISDDIQFVDLIKDRKGRNRGACLVRFSNPNITKAALKQLMGAEHDGKKIIVIEDLTGNLREKLNNDNKKTSWNEKSENIFTSDSNTASTQYSTYGLSLNYLKTLNIIPPLVNSIFIVNLDFKVDENKLREVFQMAGTIVNLRIFKDKNNTTSNGRAHIEYDHPVEAVQAVAMFNNQVLYDREMSVRLDRKETKHLSLPTGLKAIGAGLGPNGTPLKSVRNHIELQSFHLLVQKYNMKDSEMTAKTAVSNSNMENPSSSDTPAFINQTMQNDGSNLWLPNNPMTMWNANMTPTHSMNKANMTPGFSMNNANVTPALSMSNANLPTTHSMNNANMALAHAMGNASMPSMNSALNPPVASPMGVNQNLMQMFHQNGMNFSALSALSLPLQSSPLPFSMPMNMMMGKDNPEVKNFEIPEQSDQKSTDSDMVMIENLPPSVTLTILRDKMREIGDLKFAEMTGHDSAIVRFTNTYDASRCIKIFNKSRVDGQTISVRLL